MKDNGDHCSSAAYLERGQKAIRVLQEEEVLRDQDTDRDDVKGEYGNVQLVDLDSTNVDVVD